MRSPRSSCWAEPFFWFEHSGLLVVSSYCRKKELAFWSLLKRSLISSWGLHTNLITFQRSHYIGRVEFQHINFEGTHTVSGDYILMALAPWIPCPWCMLYISLSLTLPHYRFPNDFSFVHVLPVRMSLVYVHILCLFFKNEFWLFPFSLTNKKTVGQ